MVMAQEAIRESNSGEVVIPSGRDCIRGDFTVPAGARGLVLFAHGSGSTRTSPRNRLVAERLNGAGFATLLMDLLTADEEREDFLSATYRLDVELLARRLVDANRWVCGQPEFRLPRGYFGSSTGAGAALIAAAREPAGVLAIVSRGGRLDLASKYLPEVQAPTLLIVGGYDWRVLEMNEDSYDALRVEKRLEVVAGASHLFEEPGKLEVVADLAAEWFGRFLGS